MSSSTARRATDALHRFAQRAREPAPHAQLERCELCATTLHDRHEHLLNVKARTMVCACIACALLFPERTSQSIGSARYARLERKTRALPGTAFAEHEWNALGVPVRLAFLCPSAEHDTLFIVYPSPGGPVETHVPLSAWRALISAHEALAHVQLDHEAVIADAREPARASVHVSLDVIYELLGLLRAPQAGPRGSHARAFLALEARVRVLQAGGAHD